MELTQNKCTWFLPEICQNTSQSYRVKINKFVVISLYLTDTYYINVTTCKFANSNCPYYLNEIFEFALHYIIDKRNI